MIEIDRRQSLFGTVRVFERRSDGARLYCLGASVQTMAGPDGVSLFGYVHATKLLVRDARDVLIIGGAGGSLATMLARRGQAVTVVDIDPAAEQLARQHFWLDPRVAWINQDALTFIKSCRRQFDAIVIDACDDRGMIPEFADLRGLLAAWTRVRSGGSLTINLVTDDGAPAWGETLARRLLERGLSATLLRPEQGWEGNEILHLCGADAPPSLDLRDLGERPAEVRTYLASLSAYAPIRGSGGRA
jgi:SAM-dependent methyltransferase